VTLVRVQPLPDDPLKAAADFYAELVPFLAEVLNPQGGALTLALNPADYRHNDWRVAAIRELARVYAPARVNAVAGGSEAAIEAAAAYLEQAEGVTGQYLPLDDAGAGAVLDLRP
jgi:hypothetical protein